jgi:four helix bundle protein
VHNFRKLKVWNLAREVGSEIYLLCGKKTRPEAALITTQLRRSALSIAANIAEGCGKNSRAETLRYLEIAGGSAAETEHHLIVAIETGVLDPQIGTELLDRVTVVRRMLRVLGRKLPS